MKKQLFLTQFTFSLITSYVFLPMRTAEATACINKVTVYPPQLNQTVIDHMKESIKENIQSDLGQIAELMRLSFHNCAGPDGCNGHIDLKDSHNQGLEEIYPKVKTWRLEFGALLNLADFVSLAGTVATEFGLANAGCSNCTIPFRVGRHVKVSRKTDFPDGQLPDGIQKMMRMFGLNRQEAIILLGGSHSVGGCRFNCNGTFDDTENVLDNKWFNNLKNNNFAFVRDRNMTNWRTKSNDPDILFLTSDLSAAFHVKANTETFEPSCPRSIRNCKSQRARFTTIRKYASDEQAFFKDFMEVFKKMVETTPCTLTDVPA